VHSRARVLASEARFQTHCQFFCWKVRPKSAFLQAMYHGCVWKWIRSRKQNSALESRRVSFIQCQDYQNVKASYQSLSYSMSASWTLRCCKTDQETDCTTLLLETQDIERGQLQCAWDYARNPCVFNCAYPFAWSRLKFFCLCLTESTRIDLLSELGGFWDRYTKESGLYF